MELLWEAGRLIAFRADGRVVGRRLLRRRRNDAWQFRWQIHTFGPRHGIRPLARGPWTADASAARADGESRLRALCLEHDPTAEFIHKPEFPA